MALIFFLVWVILNGKITTEIILFGIGISALIYFFIWKLLGYKPTNDILLFKNFFLIIAYLCVLEYEIIKANIAVISVLFKPHCNDNAKIIKFDVDLNSDISKSILANSITITPGTITISVEDNTFTVHCIHHKFADGISESTFVKLLKRMENTKWLLNSF